MLSFCASTFLMESITRDSSPPEAIFASGFGSSPTLELSRNSSSSCPSGFHPLLPALTLRRTEGIFKNSSSFLTRDKNSFAVLCRWLVSRSAAACTCGFKRRYSSCNCAAFSSEKVISCSCWRLDCRYSKISAMELPYLRLR